MNRVTLDVGTLERVSVETTSDELIALTTSDNGQSIVLYLSLTEAAWLCDALQKGIDRIGGAR